MIIYPASPLKKSAGNRPVESTNTHYLRRRLGFIDSDSSYTSRRFHLPIILNSRQERAVLAIILPSHGEAHPYNDHTKHDTLYTKVNQTIE